MIGLSLLSQKGGVGKTTVALNLSFAFAKRGLRTLVVDADPQGAIGLSLRGKTTRDARGLSAFALEGATLDDVLVSTREPNLSPLPAGRVGGKEVDILYSQLSSDDVLPRLLGEAASHFDLALVDAPAGLVGPSIAAARATGNVLIPVQAEPLSLRTMPALLERVGSLREQGHDIRIAGVLLTMTSFRQDTALAVLEEAWALYRELVLETHVPRDNLFAKASAEGVPIGLLTRRAPPVAAVFDRVAAELEERLGILQGEDQGESLALVD